MSNFTFMASVVLSLHLVLALSQLAMLDLNPDSGNIIFNCQGSIFQGITTTGTCTNITTAQLQTDNVSDFLPDAVTNEQGASPTTIGTIFVDAVGSISKWFRGVGNAVNIGGKFLVSLITAPYNFIKAFGFPNGFTFIVGAFWYVMEIFLITNLIFGRND